MNANELAVYLEDITDWEESPYRQAANMLRQQAKELDRAVELYTDKAIKVEQLEKELTEAGHMIGVLREYISDLENGLDSSIKLNKAQAERTHPVKELTDDEIADLIKATNDEIGFGHVRIFDFVKVFLKVLRKAQEK
jgi:hypothetical protein